MPAEAKPASFHVDAASVQAHQGTRRLLVRTQEFPASVLIFSEELGKKIGREFLAPPPPAASTILAHKSARAGGVR